LIRGALRRAPKCVALADGVRSGRKKPIRMQAVSDAANRLKGTQQTANGRTRVIAVLLHQSATACLVAVVLLAPTAVWIFRDARVWPWDQAYYGTLALQIRYALHDGALAWLSAFLAVPDSRAPLLPWLAQATMPFTRVFGDPERALWLANVATGGITLGLVYSASRRLGGTLTIALTAMLACAGTSDFIAFQSTVPDGVRPGDGPSQGSRGSRCALKTRRGRGSWPRRCSG
jgi:hypothetical protein